MPGLLHNIHETQTAWPERLKIEPFPRVMAAVRAEEEWGMVRTQGGQSMKLTVHEDRVPLVGYENLVDCLYGRVGALVAPHIQVAIEVYLLQCRIIKEATKLAH
jgi:hypothetical protein